MIRMPLILMFFVYSAIASAATEKLSPQQQHVMQLYRDYAWEVVFTGVADKPTLVNESEAVLRRYLSEKLTALILKDRACVEREQGICGISFALLWASQDPQASELSVQSTEKPETVLVSFKAYGEEIKIRYVLIKTKQGWRIDDIFYSDGQSFAKSLVADLGE
jgi:hypothetical protein